MCVIKSCCWKFFLFRATFNPNNHLNLNLSLDQVHGSFNMFPGSQVTNTLGICLIYLFWVFLRFHLLSHKLLRQSAVFVASLCWKRFLWLCWSRLSLDQQLLQDEKLHHRHRGCFFSEDGFDQFSCDISWFRTIAKMLVRWNHQSSEALQTVR